MATKFCSSGGSNTAPYESWATAATSLATMLAAMANGDIGVIQYNGVPSVDSAQAADTVYTLPGNITLVSGSNDGGSAYTPTQMGTANWIGHGSSNRTTAIAGAVRALLWGITFRTAGATADNISLGFTDGQHLELENCYLWQGSTNAGGQINLGAATSAQVFVALRKCTIRFGNVGQSLYIGARVLVEGCTLSADGVAPNSLLSFTRASPGGSTVDMVGVDLSHMGSSNLVGDATTIAGVARFAQCKLGTGFNMLAAQAVANRSGAEVHLFDCSSGDTHGLMGYADALGSVVSDTGIYVTAGAAAQSWKIVTTANCGPSSPFRTPWIGKWNASPSSQTPAIEILRDGSATAYQNDKVFGEFMAKVTAGSPASSLYSDRAAIGAAPADQAAGAGTSAWTGEGGTAWSGKVDTGAAITPAEVGEILGRVGVAEPSVTLYVNPEF